MKRGAVLALALLSMTIVIPAMLRAQQAPFGEEIHLFQVEDEIYPPRGCETLFVGSSSFRFWFGLNEDFHRIRLLKRGFGGAQISDINYRFDQVVGRYHPVRIAFYAGENDLDAGKSPETVLADFISFMDRKIAVLGATPVFYISAKPSLARQSQFARQSALNRMIQQLALERDDLVYVDIVGAMLRDGKPDPALFISDGLHMNAAGYRLWRKRIWAAFRIAKASKAPGCWN